jgi:DNA-binding NarL/FixJ family response regulator
MTGGLFEAAGQIVYESITHLMSPLRILIADDHEIVRRGLIALLRPHPGWEICGEARDGREAVRMVSELRPDIVILDLGMPNLNGLEAARQMLRNDPQCKILVLTITDTDEAVRAALEAGACGFVLKSDATRDLVSAVVALQENRTFFTSQISKVVQEKLDQHRSAQENSSGQAQANLERHTSRSILTPREREVVQLLAEGKSTKGVAQHLNISEKTAETHRTNIRRKLKLRSVGELVMYAVRNNIVQVANSPSGIREPSPGRKE